MNHTSGSWSVCSPQLISTFSICQQLWLLLDLIHNQIKKQVPFLTESHFLLPKAVCAPCFCDGRSLPHQDAGHEWSFKSPVRSAWRVYSYSSITCYATLRHTHSRVNSHIVLFIHTNLHCPLPLVVTWSLFLLVAHAVFLHSLTHATAHTCTHTPLHAHAEAGRPQGLFYLNL